MNDERDDAWELRPATDRGLTTAERLRSSKREPGMTDAVFGYLWWTAMRAYMRIYHRLEVVGGDNLPRCAPFVLVANHSSHLDAMVLSCMLPRRLRSHVYPIAAGDTFFECPVVARFAAYLLNALPMWRRSAGRHALEDLRSRLVEEPCGFVLFPEGTRSRSGHMAKFRPGLGMMVAGSDIPVIPCRLIGAFEAMPAGRRLPRPRKVCLRVGEPMVFDQRSNDRESWVAISREVEAAVGALGV